MKLFLGQYKGTTGKGSGKGKEDLERGMERGTTGKGDRHFSETFFSEHITTGFFWKGGSKRGIAWKGGSPLEREMVIWKGGWKGGQLEKGIAIFRKHFFSESHFSICF